MKTPVLFIIFNRPDTTRRVFEAIRQAKPERLYVAADGARENKPGEKELCEKTREIVKSIDWECEVKTLFRERNLGCGIAVSQAISWFFENEEQGIILEDDCVPDISFFPYCEELLEYYKDNDSISIISGDNLQKGVKRDDVSYYFSNFHCIWGWATWKRVWKDFKFSVMDLNKEVIFNNLQSSNFTKEMRIYYNSIWNIMEQGRTDIWGYQFVLMNLEQGRMSIQPNVNLVENIGFSDEGTHTTADDSNKYSVKYDRIIFPLVHPQKIVPCKEADKYYVNKVLLVNKFEWVKWKFNPFRLAKRFRVKLRKFKEKKCYAISQSHLRELI
jgi:hypothetical protein